MFGAMFPMFGALSGAMLRAQVLSRPGWAGSGVSMNVWWQRGVFYRIDPERFQDSDGDGHGDLAGVAKRLDYLQSLGVDAVVLEAAPGGPAVPQDGFVELERAAVVRHIRVLVAPEIEDGPKHLKSDAQILGLARSWLTQGAAGIYLETERMVSDPVRAASLLHQMRVLTNSFPGGRILIAGAVITGDSTLLHALAQEPQLTTVQLMLPDASSKLPMAGAVRTQLTGYLDRSGATAKPVRGVSAGTSYLVSAPRVADPRLSGPLAAALLGSRVAVLLEFGQELGEQPLPDGKAAPLQWTSTNLTRLKAPEPVAQGPAVVVPKDSSTYQAFHAFIPPPNVKLPPLRMPEVVMTDAPPPVPAEMLPGFTVENAPVRPVMAANGATANVSAEDRDNESVLNLVRRLVRLHHDDAALHMGTQTFLDEDSLNVLVWVRQGSGLHGLRSVVAACNFSAQPVRLFLDADMARLHVHPGPLRGLLGVVPAAEETTETFSLPAFGVTVGEAVR